MDNNPNLFCRTDPSASDRLHVVSLQLNGLVRSRLRRFMNRQEFVGMRQSDIIAILLDREEVHPENTHSYAAKRRRVRSPSFQPHPGGQAVLVQDEHHPQMIVYGYDNVGQPSGMGKTVVSYGHHQDDDEIMEEYGADFGEEGEILDEEEQLLMNDNFGDLAGRSGKLDYRNQVGQRVEYYSTHEKIVARTDALAARLRAKRGGANAKFQQKLATGQRQWTSSLRRVWYGMVVKYQRNGLLHCRVCDTCMDVVVRGVGLRAGNAFDHACKHFGKPLFACRICSQQTTSSIEMRDHIRAVHQADTRTFVDFLDMYHADLEQMIAFCFEPAVENNANIAAPALETAMKEERPERRKRKKRRQVQTIGYHLAGGAESSSHAMCTARQFCYQMIVKWQRNNALYCRECDQWLRVGAKNNWLRSETAMQHICGHLGKPLYKCRSCPQTTATSRQIRQHLQTVHKSGIRGQYVDLTETLQEELKQIAACCFDWTEAEGGPPVNEGRFLRPRLRAGLENNTGRREALALCRRLIQSCAVDGRMQCQICATSFVATTANGYPLAETVYNHSLKHLDPPPYACRVCSKRTHNSANMRTHIWSKHKEVALTEFEDYTSQLENEIMSVLAQCFNANMVEGTEEMISQNVEDGNVVLIGQPAALLGPVCFSGVKEADGSVVLVASDQEPTMVEPCFSGNDGSAAKDVSALSRN